MAATTTLQVFLSTDNLTENESLGGSNYVMPTSLLTSGHTAKSLSFGCLHGLIVSIHALYKKKEYEKAVPKHFTASNE